MRLAAAAGSLRASGVGTLDLAGRIINLDVTASAPAMTPRQDVSWKQMSLQAHVHGPFTSPDATGQVRIDELKAGATQLRAFSADVEGNRGRIGMHAVLDRLRIPGSKPDLFESAPVDLRVDVALDDPRRPATFALSHPLVSVQGNAETGDALSGTLVINGPALAPFAALAGVDLKGHATLNASFAGRDQATKVELAGVVGVTGGATSLRALIGDGAKLASVGDVAGGEHHDRAPAIGRQDIACLRRWLRQARHRGRELEAGSVRSRGGRVALLRSDGGPGSRPGHARQIEPLGGCDRRRGDRRNSARADQGLCAPAGTSPVRPWAGSICTAASMPRPSRSRSISGRTPTAHCWPPSNARSGRARTPREASLCEQATACRKVAWSCASRSWRTSSHGWDRTWREALRPTWISSSRVDTLGPRSSWTRVMPPSVAAGSSI